MSAHSAMKTTSVVAATALGAVLIAGAPVAVSAAALGAMRQPTVVENSLAGGGSGPGGGGSGQGAGQRSGQGMGGQRGQMQGMGQEGFATVAPGSLGVASAELAAELAYLTQEEKLAHDIYVLAASRYGVNVFENISKSETTHQSAITSLLAGYSLADPTAGLAQGAFLDPAVQKLYDELAARVNSSQEQAVEVGVLIEKTDIADLQKTIDANPGEDVTTVLQRLVTASQRHLQAFERQQERAA
jgi:hypothetical protein